MWSHRAEKESAILIKQEARPRQKKNGQMAGKQMELVAGGWEVESHSPPGGNYMGVLPVALMRPNDSRPF